MQRRLDKELLHLCPIDPDKAFDNAVVIYPGVLQELRVGPIFLRFGGNLQDIKIKLVAFKDRVKVQPVIEDFNFSQSSRVIRSCLPYSVYFYTSIRGIFLQRSADSIISDNGRKFNKKR